MAIVDWPAAPTWSRAAFLALALVLAGAGLVSAGSASAASHPAPPKAAQTTFALVTGEDSNELGTVDLDTRPPVFEPALDMSGSPRDVVVAGNKTAYVLEAGPRDIAVVDLTGPNFVTTARVKLPTTASAYPTSLALTPDDSRAFVTFGWGSPMEVVDLTKTPPVVSAQIPVPFGSQATDAAITPDGKTALVISVNNAIAFPVDLTTNPPTPGPAIQLPPDAQPCGVTVAPNGRFALVTNGSKRSVTMIDLTKTPPVAAPAIDTRGSVPCKVLITPDSRSAYVLNLYGNSVTPMVLTGDRPAVQDPIGLNGGTFPIDLVLSDGGKELIVANAVGSTLTPIDLTASPPKAGSLVTLGVLARPAGIALVTRDVLPGEATKTQLTSSPSPSLRRQPATFTAKVSTSSGAAAAGAVTFKLDGNVVGTPVTLDDNGVASMSTDELSVGQHHVVARFSGDSRFRSSADQLRHAVDVAPTTTRISASASPTVFGQHVVVTAAVTPNAPAGGTPSGVVTFKVDSKPVGSPVPLVKGSATAALLQLAPGPHEITADYSGGGGYQASQASLSPPYRVNRAATTVTIEAAANDLRQGDPNLFLATVSSVAPGRGVPDGSVAFTVDGVASGGPIVLVGGQALQTLELTPGRHRIGATYTGAANYEPSTGAIDRDIQP